LELIKNLGIFTIIGGLIAFIIRSFINKYFDKRIKEFELDLSNKAELYKAELEKESQKYKSELDIHFSKVSRFHEKRLEIISELYNKVVDLRQNLTNLTSTLIFSSGDEQKDDEEKKTKEN
jgi:predicted PurR-regulated permease PerM